jgi:transposase
LRHVEIVCKADDDLQQVYDLAQDIVKMVAQRKGEELEAWLQRAERSDAATLKGFVQSLRRDYAAVAAGLAYGRASFDLLRLRVLQGSGRTNQQREKQLAG